MRKIGLSLAMCCAMIIGVAQAVYEIQQPVGSVTDMFCKRPESPCVAFSYEVTHEVVASVSKP